ncbi:MAG: hypothetical protein P4L46_00515 [Fimbriimonas sp.]|nr:hypothetical protein [Fimbriimonas sp.]
MHFERLAQHSTALIGCLAWLPLSVWIMACVHWMIGGDIDGLTGFGGIAVALGLGYEAINPPVPQLAPMTVIAVFITVVMFPFVRSAMDKKALRNIDIDELVKAYNSLSMRPDNVLAKIKIARVLWDLGVCGHAIRIVESQLPHMPPRFFGEDIHMLKRWHMMKLEARFFSPISCTECQTSNEAGLVYCRQCGSAFLIDFVKGRVIGTRLGKKLIASWTALVAILIGIPAAEAMPPVASIPAILAMMVVAVLIVYFAFRDTTSGVAT